MRLNLVKIAAVLAVSITLFGSVIALAQTSNGQTSAKGAGDNKGKGPPPQMIVACANMTAGATCTATGPEGRAISGTCFAPQGRPLACRPTNKAQKKGATGQGSENKPAPPKGS
jgi:hypothetical protein